MLFAGCQKRRGEDNRLWSLTPPFQLVCTRRIWDAASATSSGEPETFKRHRAFIHEGLASGGVRETGRRTLDLKLTGSVKRWHLGVRLVLIAMVYKGLYHDSRSYTFIST